MVAAFVSQLGSMHQENLLDGAVVKITEVFTPDHENRTIQCLYHHNRGYAYAIAVRSNWCLSIVTTCDASTINK